MNQDLLLNTLRREPDQALPKITENPTYIPDDIMKSLTPVLVFRHPALIVPSQHKAANEVSGLESEGEDYSIWCSIQWTRYLYEYFVAKGQSPAVIEAQDFVHNTKPTMDALCRHLGIEEDGWAKTWDPLPRSIGLTTVSPSR